MYRGSRHDGPRGGARHIDDSFMADRAVDRERSTHRSFWDRSPTPPKRKPKPAKRSPSPQSSTSRDSASVESKKRKRKRKSKSKKHKSRSKSKSHRSKRRERRRTRSSSESESNDSLRKLDEEVAAQERSHANVMRKNPPTNDQSSDDEGPLPLSAQHDAPRRGTGSANYGGALLPGEGQAIAQYVQQNKRVPRRGEVGWQGEEIDELEQAGYVMSGSRHSRMNAIRLRKENQVYTAEEKRALAMLNYEQQKQKEARLVAEMRALVDGEPMPADLPDEQPSAVAVAMAAQLGLNAQEPVDEGPKRAPI